MSDNVVASFSHELIGFISYYASWQYFDHVWRLILENSITPRCANTVLISTPLSCRKDGIEPWSKAKTGTCTGRHSPKK